jgi:hypothetical protein
VRWRSWSACSLRLSEAQMERLEGLLWEHPVAGPRYPEAMMATIDR